ncbi:MAG: hypothetical protein ACRDTH_00800 [Pseudonocardiaceae bacterium]
MCADIVGVGQWLFGAVGVLDEVTDSGSRGGVAGIGDCDEGADLVEFGFGVPECGEATATHGVASFVASREFDLDVPHAVIGAPGAVAAA